MSEIIELVHDDCTERMEKAVAHTKGEYAGVRSGRAAPQLIERLSVEAYGVKMGIIEIASISIPESRQLLVTPHDPTNLEAIEKAIRNSDLGLSPTNDGRTLRLNFPPLTSERRTELVRLVRAMAEDGRIAIRSIRRDGRKDLESAEKDKDISSDELQRAEGVLDDMTKSSIGNLDSALADKEEELMEV